MIHIQKTRKLQRKNVHNKNLFRQQKFRSLQTTPVVDTDISNQQPPEKNEKNENVKQSIECDDETYKKFQDFLKQNNNTMTKETKENTTNLDIIDVEDEEHLESLLLN